MRFIALGLALIASPCWAQQVQCGIFDIEINGTVATANFGTQQVHLAELALVRIPGVRGNPVDLVIDSGKDLNGQQGVEIGNIDLMTNSNWADNPGIRGAKIDLAQVSSSGQFRINTDASFQMPQPNVFIGGGINSTGGGLGGVCNLPNQAMCNDTRGSALLSVSYYIPRQGGGQFTLLRDGQGIEGSFQVRGSGLDNPNVAASYQAQFRGSRRRAECPQ